MVIRNSRLPGDNLGYITSISTLGRKGFLLTRGRGIGQYEANTNYDSIVLSGGHIIKELLRDPYLKTRWASANDMLFKVGYSLYRYSVKDESLKRCYESNDELNHINSYPGPMIRYGFARATA